MVIDHPEGTGSRRAVPKYQVWEGPQHHRSCWDLLTQKKLPLKPVLSDEIVDGDVVVVDSRLGGGLVCRKCFVLQQYLKFQIVGIHCGRQDDLFCTFCFSWCDDAWCFHTKRNSPIQLSLHLEFKSHCFCIQTMLLCKISKSYRWADSIWVRIATKTRIFDIFLPLTYL